ncbi:MAG: hypothetical protein ACT4OI_01955 [Methanobacteriota archaeon]
MAWPPPSGWGAPTPRQAPQIVAALVAVAFVVVFLVIGAGLVVPFGTGFSVILPAVCGAVIFVVVLVVVALSSGMQRRTLPPPPPIQQPMVPAGTQGAVELACPNCGAAPRTVDRFGVATCDYCDTRFLAR